VRLDVRQARLDCELARKLVDQFRNGVVNNARSERDATARRWK
jgi:hypothetical protein